MAKKIAENNPATTHTIDASGQILGRLATQAAIWLRGKHKPSFRPNLLAGDKVLIINAAKVKVSGNKMNDKLYRRHSGYIGHLKTQTMGELFRNDPSEVIRRAVRGMLPKNKLQTPWMKNLIIKNGLNPPTAGRPNGTEQGEKNG